MTYETLQYELYEGIATIRFNRPDKFNALNKTVLSELSKALKDSARNSEVRVIVLTGEGKAFCAGQDLSELDPETPLLYTVRHHFNPVLLTMRQLEKPIIGAINGVAAGAGLGLALATDLRVMSNKASFVFAAFSRIALVPDSGLTYFLPRLVGMSKAFELLLLADSQHRMSAEEAKSWGLCTLIADAEDFMTTVQQFASQIADMPLNAVGMTKRLLNKSWDYTFEQMLDLEAQLQDAASRHPNAHEGIQAFLEKRTPNFRS
ncbi:MAG: 2-(1,2-epoxy-1,2-dihydrophenyl)acetyl-CoA isomerase [Phototrophicales bacterium]|nr:MAG: 2-(1,2-epoxy-1,2-dihydrophenyl)acetyl-CoA isomerase [Phototrophicales bacterium]